MGAVANFNSIAAAAAAAGGGRRTIMLHPSPVSCRDRRAVCLTLLSPSECIRSRGERDAACSWHIGTAFGVA